MTDFQEVRAEARRKGKLGEGGGPIPFHPSNLFIVKRLVSLPIKDSAGKKKVGFYRKCPANIIVVAWNAADASARADEIVSNAMEREWSMGSRPWGGTQESKISWVEVPYDDPYPLELR